MTDDRNAENSPWRIIVVGSSHNDIGWAGTPSEIAEHREHKIIDGVLDLLDRDSHYAYAVEASLYADEYLERNPQRADFVRDLVASGRLEWGGTYVQPYEGLYSGEAMLRQVEYGRRSILEHWGIETRGAWNVDVQGRTRNLAQIYKPAGIDYLIVSRCKPGIYWWEAQDGSRLLVLSLMQGHYGYPFLNTNELHSSPLEAEADGDGGFDIDRAAARLRDLVTKFEPFFAETGLPRAILVCVTADYTVPSGALSRFIDSWNDRAESIATEHGINATLEYGTARSYVELLETSGSLDAVPVVKGEMPNPWLYIHGPGHHKTVDAMRRAQADLLAAEQLQVVRHPEGLPAASRERGELDRAWREHLYVDHGFGGLHGVGTDEVFRYKAESALHAANGSIEESLTTLAAQRRVDADQVLVYNPVSFARTDWVEVEIELREPLTDETIEFVTDEGRAVRAHVLDVKSPRGMRTGLARVGFIAPDVPPLSSIVLTRAGTGDVAAAGSESSVADSTGNRTAHGAGDISWSNPFYEVTVSRGGIAMVNDSATGQRAIDCTRYLVGETIALDSPGIDVGQHEQDGSWDYTIVEPFQPKLTGFERTGDAGADPHVVFRSDEVLRVESEAPLAGSTIRNTYTFYRDLSYFDLRVEVLGWSGEHGRELRVCFPFFETAAEVAYEVPFGDVTAGRDEIEGFRAMRPREVQNWLQAVDGERALTVSGSVAVYDWIDIDESSDATVLQAILFATKRSCHSQGNWYEQAGDHTARFRIDPTGAAAAKRTLLGAGHAAPLRARRGGRVDPHESRLIDSAQPVGVPAWLVPDSSAALVTSIRPIEAGLLIRYWAYGDAGAVVDLSERPDGTTLALSDPFGDERVPLEGAHIEIAPHAQRTVVVGLGASHT